MGVRLLVTISINQISSGIGLRVDGVLYVVSEYTHVKPGKGSAFVRIKLKNVHTGQVVERTFKSADKLEDIQLDERKIQYLYRSDDTFHFMDNTTYEQIEVSLGTVNDVLKFLQDDLEVTGLFYDEKVLKINLPTFIIAEITHTEPGFKGDSSKAGNKPATIDTGTSIQVPLFVNIEDFVKIDTRTGEYVERVQK